MELEIRTTWDSQPLNHEPVKIRLCKGDNAEKPTVRLEVRAPFWDDCPRPDGLPGPFMKLWDYEVVEVFFLGDHNRYLEVELSPYGHYLILLLAGHKSDIVKSMLPLEFTSNVIKGADGQKQWHGTCDIDAMYLPSGVQKINVYAIHGSGEQRVYEALYPAPQRKHDQPDFHRLEYFKAVSTEFGLELDSLRDVHKHNSYWDISSS